MSVIRTAILLAGLTALFGVVGWAIGGQNGMLIALGIALLMNLFAYWKSDELVLKMYRAEPLRQEDSPELYSMIDALAQRADIPIPKAYIIHNEQPNAFATGRNPQHAAIAITSGLLHRLNKREIAGVIAHEMAHIKNRDTLTMTITATIAGAISMLANFAFFFGGDRNRENPLGAVSVLLMIILAPIAAMLVQMAISRTREYAADHTGAMIANDPLGLASALEKISDLAAHIPNPEAEQSPATAHLFIMNPLHAHRMDNLFTTHPDPRNRISRLQKLAREMNL